MPERSAAERLASLERPDQHDLVLCVRNGSSVIGEAKMDSGTLLEMTASNLRNERTGVHARVEISEGDNPLAWNVFNIERDEDRTRLANSAAKRMGDPRALGPPIKLRLDTFCAQVWPTWVQGDNGTWESGAERRTSWLLEPWLLEGAGTILYGPPSTAKSWVTMLWALGITHGGGPFAMTTAGPVLLVNLERPADLVRVRIRETARVLGLPERLLSLHGRGRSLSDVSDAVRQTVEREGCTAVVVDSLSRAGTGDLTANEPANRGMDILNSFGCAWCVIAHTPRSDGSHVFGSVMHEAAADLCIRISAAESSADGGYAVGVKLECTKANDVRKGRPEVWALIFADGDGGLVDFRRAEPGEFVDLEVGAMTIEERIAEELQAGAQTTKQLAEELDLSVAVVGATCRRSSRFVRIPNPAGGRGRSACWGLAEGS